MLPAPAAMARAGALGADAAPANRPGLDTSLTGCAARGPGAKALSAFTEWRTDADGTRLARSRLKLSGMHCAACAGLIEALLQARPGVRSAQVNPSTQALTLDWSPAAVTLDELRHSLAGAGYDFAPDLAGPARDLRRREHRQALWRWFVAGFLMMQVMMLAWPSYVAAPGEIPPDQAALLRWGQWVLTLPVMLLSAGPFFRAAFMQLKGRRLGMDVPVALGLAVAFAAGSGATLDPGGPFGHEVYFDSITMFVSFLLGARYLELRARHRAAEALEQAADALPGKVERLAPDGMADWVDIDQLAPGDLVRVAAGQRIPADASVESGHGAADESLLTGESRPVSKAPGDAVLAGSLNLAGALTLRVLRTGESTRLAGIRQLMAQAFEDRPATLRMADRVAGWFLLAVLALAAAAAVAWQFFDPSRAVSVAVSVLIVTCPCALSLAAPAAWIAAAGALARRGLLLTRLDAIEALAQVDRIVMDKTGTLTDPAPRMARQWPPVLDAEATAAAKALAGASRHPLSRALTDTLTDTLGAPTTPTPGGWSSIEEFSGRGLQGVDARGRSWRLGSPRWATAGTAPETDAIEDAQIVLGCEGRARAAWTFDESLREGAAAALGAWRAMGKEIDLLSGDAPSRVAAIAARAGLVRWRAAAGPEEKLEHVAALQSRGHRVLMIGDGINDAPVLARAQVSIAMGQGADLAKARADALLLSDRLDAVTAALRLARRTRRVVRQNLAWSALYNAVCVPMALLGWLPPWAAGLGMAMSSLLVVCNAARLGRAAAAHR
jgi:Cu2+-exporting ATPase